MKMTPNRLIVAAIAIILLVGTGCAGGDLAYDEQDVIVGESLLGPCSDWGVIYAQSENGGIFLCPGEEDTGLPFDGPVGSLPLCTSEGRMCDVLLHSPGIVWVTETDKEGESTGEYVVFYYETPGGMTGHGEQATTKNEGVIKIYF